MGNRRSALSASLKWNETRRLDVSRLEGPGSRRFGEGRPPPRKATAIEDEAGRHRRGCAGRIAARPKHRMDDGAAVAEGAHAARAAAASASAARRRRGPLRRQRACHLAQRCVHVRVDRAQLPVRRRGGCSQSDAQPQQARDARRGLGMPAVGLDAAERESLGAAARVQQCGQRRSSWLLELPLGANMREYTN